MTDQFNRKLASAVRTTWPTKVRIKIDHGQSGAYFASSPDVGGFGAVCADRKRLEDELIAKYLNDLYAAAGHPAPTFTIVK
jgi:hypothetical protein